ncbi:hypothetical protein GCM10022419_048490 [Nonomuraea rosea]|uniref:Chaplin n=1 Tax=Nonomuraea rosea TaxID=638574 RepID=A0ABP6X8J2_9ACTN
MRTGLSVAVLAVMTGVMTGAACADTGKQGPSSLIGDVIIFNDEIVEPVSLPVSTCGALLPLLSKAPSTCKDASRVSDDDA